MTKSSMLPVKPNTLGSGVPSITGLALNKSVPSTPTKVNLPAAAIILIDVAHEPATERTQTLITQDLLRNHTRWPAQIIAKPAAPENFNPQDPGVPITAGLAEQKSVSSKTIERNPHAVFLTDGPRKNLTLENFSLNITNGEVDYHGPVEIGLPARHADPKLVLKLMKNACHQILLIDRYQKKEHVSNLDELAAHNFMQKYPKLCLDLMGRN